MKIFKQKKTVFITIDFAGIPGLFDYPKHLPIPAIGDQVHFDGKFGVVSNVKHMTNGTVTEIKIESVPKEEIPEGEHDEPKPVFIHGIEDTGNFDKEISFCTSCNRFFESKPEPKKAEEDSIAGFIDWNKLTIDQYIDFLEKKYRFDSSGTAKAIYEVIEAYKKLR